MSRPRNRISPAGRLDQPVDAAHERRLAGPGRADDRGHAAPGYGERDISEHRLARAVLLAEVADDQRAVVNRRSRPAV